MDWCRRGNVNVNVLCISAAFRTTIGGGYLAGIRSASESDFPGID